MAPPATLSTPAHPTLLHPLQLDPAQHPRGLSHLSAASGLVRVRQRLYVVADDELHLGQFDDCSSPTPNAAPGTLLRLLDGELPAGKKQRKAAKPDLESLALLPPLPGCPPVRCWRWGLARGRTAKPACWWHWTCWASPMAAWPR